MTRGANMLFNAVKLASSTWFSMALTHIWNEPLKTDKWHSMLVSFSSTEGCSWFTSTPCSRRSLSKHKKCKSQNTCVKQELHKRPVFINLSWILSNSCLHLTSTIDEGVHTEHTVYAAHTFAGETWTKAENSTVFVLITVYVKTPHLDRTHTCTHKYTQDKSIYNN